MKLNKREIISLSILALLVFSIGLYKFVIAPQRESLDTLKTQRDLKRGELSKLETDIASEGKLFVELLKLEDELGKKASKFFTTTTQEDIILLTTEMLKENKLTTSSITFPETRLETIREKEEVEGEEKKEEENDEEDDGEEITLKVYSTDIEYEGYYYSFIDFLNAVEQYDKKIVVKSMDIAKEDDGYLRGNVVLDFYTIGNIMDIDEMLYAWGPNLGSIVGDPFLEFSDYLAMKDSGKDDGKQTEEDDSEEKFWSSLIDTIGSITGGGSSSSTDITDTSSESSLYVRKTIFGFENINTIFFVGSHKDMKGDLKLNKKSVEGKNSVNFKYDFIEKRDTNTANISFNNTVVISEQPEMLSLSVNPLDKSDCSLGIIIRDKEGNSHKIPLSDKLDWKGWETLTVDLPIEINYPAVVERIYIEGTDFYEKLTGNILIDNLEILQNK